MRKKIFGKKLARSRKTREALFVNLVREVIMHGEIKTTLAKAQAIVPDLEKIMGITRDTSLAAKRRAAALLRNDREAVEKLFGYSEFAQSKQSGYTRITRLPARAGDQAEMAKIGWSLDKNKTEVAPKKAAKSSQEVDSSENDSLSATDDKE